ncbi:MAG: T9SS type A sorting domain-containing protein [Bacteroidia bacterium]
MIRSKLPSILFLFFSILSHYCFSTIFYSQANNQPFSNLLSWNSTAGGGGANPIAADLTNGTNTFVIQNGHTITVDQNISVDALTVGGGASGILTIGNSTTSRNISVAGNLSINSGATINVGIFNAVHSLTVSGNISNAGTLNLVNTPITRVCNTILNGSGYPQILGTSTPTFNDLTISGGASGADITRAISVLGNLLVTNNTPLTTAQSSSITGTFTVNNGSTFVASGGAITFNNLSSQSIDVNNATFSAISFAGAGTKTIIGDIIANSLLTVGAGVTVTDAGNSHLLKAGLTINNTGVLNFSGVVDLSGALTTGYDFNAGNITNMGTAAWTFSNSVTTALTGGAVAGQFKFAGDLTITAGTTTISNNTSIVSTGTSFSLTGTASLAINGLTKLGGITNFPLGFSSYVIANTTTVRYAMVGDQVITAGPDVSYGNLQLSNNTKTVNGTPLLISGNLSLTSVIADLSGTDVTIGGNIANAGTCSFINNNTVIIDGNNTNQLIGAGATYNFNNLTIAQSILPSSSKTKTFGANITVDGNFTASNLGGSNAVLNIIDLQNFAILDGTPSGTFSLQSNVQLNVSGATASELQTTFDNFATIKLDATPLNQSRVRFSNLTAATVQLIPYRNTVGSFSYGTIELYGNNTKKAAGPLDINGNMTYIGGSVIFDDGNFDHTIAGDWLIWSTIYANPGPTSTITFDGTEPQYIGNNSTSYQFRNVVIANSTSVVSINCSAGYTVAFLGDLTINTGAALDASNKNIAIAGNWVQLGTGIFTQTATTTFNGLLVNQTINIATPATSYFGNLTISKNVGAAPQTVTAQKDMIVSGSLSLTANQATFDASNVTVKIGANWIFNANTSFISTGSTLLFNGNGAQSIINTATNPTFNNITFAGTGVKTFSYNPILVNGNFDITASTVNWGGASILTLMGDWLNTANTGVFNPSSGTLLLNGGAQNLDAGPFYIVRASGTSGTTKIFTNNIVLNNSLIIDANITLDVSASNYSLSVGGNWINNGAFTCRTGTVTLTGAAATINTGAASGYNTGNNFYNLIVNKSASANNVIFPAANDLTVLNDITITTGTVYLQTSADAYIGGNFLNSDVFTATNNACQVNLTASTGIKTFDPGISAATTFRNILVNASGATYKLGNNLAISSAGVFSLVGGTFLLNGKSMSLTGAPAGTTVVAIGAGTFFVDAGSTLRLSDQTVITINDAAAIFKVLGSSTNYAIITTNGSTSSGYTINQSVGVFHAKYYTFSNLRTTGITLSGSTVIDATNNFSNGTFTSPASTGLLQYLDVSGISLGALKPVGTVFSVGTAGSKNVKASAATTGYIEFTDPSGVLQGAINENDDGVAATGKVRWTYNGYFWTDGGNDGNWFNTANWSTASIPTATDNVYIDHSVKSGAFSNPVTINAAGAVSNNLTVNAGAGTPITLSITASGSLTSNGNVSILATNVLAFTGAGTYNIKGGFAYAGAASVPTFGTVAFTGTSGSNTVTSGNFQFYNFTVNAPGANYILASAIMVTNDLTISNGTLDISGSNFAITCNGNWNVSGGGVFNKQLGTVTLSKLGVSTQTITGGAFYNLIIDNATPATTAVKALSNECTIFGSLTIGAGGAGVAQLITGTNDLYVYGNWTNNSLNGFISSGTVNFNGTSGTQTIGGTQSSAFNTLVLSGAANKTLNISEQVNADLQVSTTSGTVTFGASTIITDGGGSNTFTVAGSTTVIVLGDFPVVFETVSLSATSVVRYQANGAQSIYSVASPGYGNLFLYANIAGNATTKTAAGDLFIQTGITIGVNNTDVNVTLAMNNYSMTLTGTSFIQQTGAPQVIWGTGTMTQNGGIWLIDSDITGFNNLVISGTGSKIMSANLNLITGNVSIQSAATLNMATYTLTCIGASKTLNIQAGGTLTSALTTSVAFPTGFANYNLNPLSTVILNGATDQTIQCTNVVYGNLSLTPSAAASDVLNSNLSCAGDFLMSNNSTLVDAGYNMNFSGNNIDIRTYTPTLSTSTITLSGGTQNFYSGFYTSNFAVGNVIFGGTTNSVKSLGSRTGVANNVIYLSGKVIINSSITVTCTRNLFYSGSSWINNGTYNHSGGLYTFNGTTLQTINPGASNNYYSIAVSNTNNPGVVITSNGIVITTTTLINANARFDMGGAAAPAASLTHSFGGSITNNGYWFTANSHLILNGGNYTIPVNDAVTPATTFTARNVTIGANYKILASTTTWQTDNLTINVAAVFNPGSATNTINVKGDWICNGTFVSNGNTVNFNGNGSVNTATANIVVNTSPFYTVNFIPTGTAVMYTLQSNTTSIQADMTIAALGTLNLNGNVLNLGRSAAAVKTYTINGVLNVNANAFLNFDNRGSATPGVSQCIMNVSGSGAKLKILGVSNAAIATITAIQGGTQAIGYSTLITITSGAEIQARYYSLNYLADAGMVLTNTAIINTINNFSDGTWTYMNTSATGATNRYYLDCEAPAPSGTIANVTFNYGVSPVPANRYNVKRSTAATVLKFADVITGALGSYLYESDDVSATTGKITWPPSINANWIGGVSSNFNDGLNWSSGSVPNPNTNCVIGAVVAPNLSPVINVTSGVAVCKTLTITTGRLDLNGGLAGVDLDIKSSIVIGTTGAGILAVANPDVTIQVGGSWTRGLIAGTAFINGNGTVEFTTNSGTFTVDPKTTGNYAFGNVVFNGATSSMNIIGGITTAGNFTINDATVIPANGITLNIGGDYYNNNGTFIANTTNTSTVVLTRGGAQTINNATFYNLTVSGSGSKTFSSNCSVYNNTIINNGATLKGPTGIEVLTLGSSNTGIVTINSGGMFDDNGGSPVFNGSTWTATTTSYTGSGTMTFNRNGSQTIAGGQFNNLSLTTTGNITVSGDVAIIGGVDVYLAIAGNSLVLNNNFKITGSGTGTFLLGSDKVLNVNGTNNCPSGFLAYAFDPTSTTNYSQAFDQVIGSITYGNLTLNTATTKTLAGDIGVLGSLTINNSTLDVSASNYDITVSGNFNNNSTGSLVTTGAAHAGKIILDGSGTQNIYIGSSGAKSIYNLTINKTTGSVANVSTNNIVITKDLLVQAGTFNLNGLVGYIGGNTTVVSASGSISQSGTFNFNAVSGTKTIQLSGSNLNNVIINAPGVTYKAQDNISVYGNTTITAGTFDGNGKYVNLGNIGGRTILIAAGSVYKIGAGGTMALASTAAVQVAGTIEIVGTPGAIATVTKASGGNYYGFDVTGTIKAQYYLFEYMAASGIVINSSASVDATNNFSDGAFTNGPNNCKYLTFSNNQTLTINNVAFSYAPTGSANNVVKSTAGIVTFYNATGIFSGASYESDDGSASTGAIRWTGSETLNWIGAVSTDWYNASNWASNLGGSGIPDATKNAIIATNTSNRNPIINGSGGTARCKNLTVNSTMILTVNTPAGVSDLLISGDVQINGEIRAASATDYIEVTGNWVKAPAGTCNLTNGTVTFTGTGSKTINNGTGSFKNVTINNAGLTALLGANTIVNGDLIISAGSLDVSGSFYSLNVKGNWINNGNFISAIGSTATVTLSSVNTGVIILNPGSSSFNNLIINGTASTVYTLTTNNLSTAGSTIITSGELNLNSLIFNAGNNVGSDPLNISGKLTVNQNSFLKLGTGSALTVLSGGTVKIVGTSGNSGTVTKQTSGSTYAFTINSGGTIQAQYYVFEYMNVAGIVVNSGATINLTDNFSNGAFSNGFAGGKFLTLLNNFTSYTANGVSFNSGPTYSVSRLSGTGEITFNDPIGPLANYLYEQDDNSPSTGLVRWTYTNPQLIWTGVASTDWQDPDNWASTGPPGPPDLTMDVTISSSAPFQPVLTANALTSDFTLASGTTLAMGSYNMNVSGGFSNNGGSFTSASTVTMSALTGVIKIDPGTSSFYNLTIAGTGNFSTAKSISIANDFTITSGSNFTISNPAHTLTIGNNWTSTGATFTHGNGTVVFNKNSGTSSLVTGASGTGGVTFYNLNVIQALNAPTQLKTQTLTGNLTVAGTLLISSTKCIFSFGTGNTVSLNGALTFGNGAMLQGGSATINVSGSWLNNIGSPFAYGTSTVVFNGTTPQTITRSTSIGETFYNLKIDNSTGVTFAKPVVVYGNLVLSNGLVTTTATNILTMAAGSTTNIGSASSYIVGPMKYSVVKIGTTALSFPIGKGASWRPVQLSVNHSTIDAATYTAEMFNSSPKSLGYTINGATITSVSSMRYWQIDRVGIGALTGASVTLYYKSGVSSDGVTDPSNLRIAKTIGTGTVWNDVGGAGSAIGDGFISSLAFTSFSKFTLANRAGGLNPLPIELTSFTATPIKKHIQLNWTTMSEKNNDYFTIEKSFDGIKFEELVRVKGAGNSSNEINYSTIDLDPNEGVNYYRLKQTDYDGGYFYSNIVFVNTNTDTKLSFNVYPNPTINNQINIVLTGNSGKQVNVIIRDVLGKECYNKTIQLSTGNYTLHIDRDGSIPAGIYFIVTTSNTGIFSQKVIVN